MVHLADGIEGVLVVVVKCPHRLGGGKEKGSRVNNRLRLRVRFGFGFGWSGSSGVSGSSGAEWSGEE